jgi:hypothetical protein
MVFMDQHTFSTLVDEIVKLGYDRETAGDYAALIGDIPITDADGKIVVMGGTKVLARLELNFFEESPKNYRGTLPGSDSKDHDARL